MRWLGLSCSIEDGLLEESASMREVSRLTVVLGLEVVVSRVGLRTSFGRARLADQKFKPVCLYK